MKKHIGIYNDDNAVREALRTKELNKPYLVYVHNYGQVMYDPWIYIDARLDWNIRDEISITYNDQNSHYFQIICYTTMWYELVDASSAITFSSLETTGYTSIFGDYFTVAENSGDARVLSFSFDFREEENGPVVYRVTYKINQGANTSAVVGWYVDGEVTTDSIHLPQSGGTAQIKIKNASDWSILDPEYQIIYSGTTDDVVTVSVAANETYDTQWLNYMVFWQTGGGGGGSLTLTVEQEGLEAPSINVDNYVYQDNITNNYYVENSSSALTIGFDNIGSGMVWEIIDGNSNVLASGDTNSEYDVPVASNTGNTPAMAFDISGTPAPQIIAMVWADSTKESLITNAYITAYVLPANSCVFDVFSPANTSPTEVGFQGETRPVIVYNYDGRILVSDFFTSTSSAFTDTWSSDGEQIDIGWKFDVSASSNEEEEQIPVTYNVTLGVDDQGTDDDTYTINFLQAAYVAPEVYVPYDTEYYASGLYLIRYNSMRARVNVNNTIEGDVILFSTDGENWDELPNNRYEVSPLSANTGVCPIMVIPQLWVKVQRAGMDIVDDFVRVAQDTSSRPWIGWDTNPENEITLPEGDAAGYLFAQQPGSYSLVNVSASGTGFSVSIDSESGEIWLETQENNTGNVIDGSVTAIFEDGEQNQVSYTVTVHQPVYAA